MTGAFRSAFLLSVSLGGLLGATALLHEAGPAPARAAESALKPAEAEPMPPEATALCKDGSWSTSDGKKGACSRHGGIKTWFGKPPKGATARCKDGTYSKSAESQGACSQHGGVATWLKTH
jgi:hypothetical protein